MSSGAEGFARERVAAVCVVDDVVHTCSAGSIGDRGPRGEDLQAPPLAAVTARSVVDDPAVTDLTGEPAGTVDELAVVNDGASHTGTDVQPDEGTRVCGDPVACLGQRRRLGAVVSVGRDRERVADRLRDRDIAPVEVRRDRADATRMVDETGDRDGSAPEPGRSACRRLAMPRARVVERARPTVLARPTAESQVRLASDLGATVGDGDGRVVDADVDAEIRLGAGIEVEQRRWAPARRLADARFHDDTVGDQLVDDPRDRRLGQERPLRDLGPGHGSGPAEEVEDDGAVVPAHHLTVDLGGACHQGRTLVRSPNKGGAPTPATNAKRWRMSDRYVPSPDDHFTFGLWTVGNPGRDPFGHEVRPPLDPVDSVRAPRRGGCVRRELPRRRPRPAGVLGRPSAKRSSKRFRRALDETGLQGADGDVQPVLAACVPIDGAFTANDVHVRRFAVAKTLDAIDLGVELGARGLRDVGRS